MSEAWAQTQVPRLASLIAALSLALIVIAGLDLGANGDAAFSSPLVTSSSIATTHAIVAMLTAAATLLLAAIAWLRLRDDPRVVRASIVAFVLITVQLVALTSSAATAAPWAAAAHLGATALLLATALTLAVAGGLTPLVRPMSIPSPIRRDIPLAYLVPAAAMTIFGVLVSGAYLAAGHHASCDGWPLCGTSERSVAFLDPQNIHRLFVGGSGLFLIVLAASLMRRGMRPFLPLALLAVFVIEAIVGAIAAGGADSPAITGTHFGAAGIAWMLLVVVGLATFPARAGALQVTTAATSDASSRIRDYLRVTKPGIMLLLLITTLGAMLIAPGWPSAWLIVATLAGGALASGGASALNCYLDRDIDVVMARTRRRPIPTGTLTPAQVRNFGILLSAAAVVELWVLVNPVASMLALGGNVFYVVIYTRFLKRSTPQNIVIGGAAGAFPPLVGWAAVTGSISLASMLLFALIYYWTPPHFWSLALLKSRDYERAGIPMLPVTHGDHQTRRHILLYSFMLVAISFLAVPAGIAGSVYLIAAIVLGAIFIGLAARMYVERTSRLAWRLFKYSNYYLAALLLAMVIDRVG